VATVNDSHFANAVIWSPGP